jgi:hypothetical protein
MQSYVLVAENAIKEWQPLSEESRSLLVIFKRLSQMPFEGRQRRPAMAALTSPRPAQAPPGGFKIGSSPETHNHEGTEPHGCRDERNLRRKFIERLNPPWWWTQACRNKSGQ